MEIFNHFKDLKLSQDQTKALEMIEDFIMSNDSIFILKGYAGSGKTTLLKGIVSYLKELGKDFRLMAPTGRAARVLSKKTKTEATTIHRAIYAFGNLKIIDKDVKEKNEKEHTYKYTYPIASLQENVKKIIIVDEASMVSNKENKHELFEFGTSILLQDLLTYSQVKNSDNKIIFVGDPAQLPPVGDDKSEALNADFFKEKGLAVRQVEMTQVLRQRDNSILRNAIKIRELIAKPVKSEIVLDYDDCFTKINNMDIARKYTDLISVPKLGQAVVISYSNGQCLRYNQCIRSILFPEKTTPTQGDILLVCNNNYNYDLYNGDMVELVDMSDDVVVKKDIPVYENGEKKPQTLVFRKVKIRSEEEESDKEVYIIENLLNSDANDLTIAQMKALYVDFMIRFNKICPQPVKKGNQNYEKERETYEEKLKIGLKNDKFFNALRVKYGYAITCHKAQGGEWDTIFVDYYGRTSLRQDPLRWCYTATTRGSKKCYAANAPYLTSMSLLSISQIEQISKIPENALSLENVPVSPYHKENQHRAKSMKFWEVRQKLEDTPYVVENVVSLGEYRERYTISCQGEKADFDICHNKAGFFNDFSPVRNQKYSWERQFLELMEKPYTQENYNLNYAPSLPVLEKLYFAMQMACQQTDVIITNIEEKKENFMVIYFLKTSSKAAYIQFYFNGREQLTRALCKSFDREDQMLNKLIVKLKENVI